MHVALSVCSLQLAGFYFMRIPMDLLLVAFTFLAAISGYNFVKYAERARWYHKSLPVELRRIQIFSLICFIALIAIGLMLPVLTMAGFAALALLTMFYVIPMLPQAKNLRNLAGIKIFVVALVWAATAVAIPLWHAQISPQADDYILFTQIFLLVFALTIPFEIRDLHIDEVQLKTLPQILGVDKSRYLGMIAVILAAALDAFKDDFFFVSNVYWLGLALLSVYALLKSKKQQSEYMASFWIEAIPIAGFLFLLAFDFALFFG